MFSSARRSWLVRAIAFAFPLIAAPSFSRQLTSDHLKDWRWRLVGPSAPAGRAWTVIGVVRDPQTPHVTTAGGGLWKFTDNRTNILPHFNDPASPPAGAVGGVKTHSQILWLG